MVSLEFWSDDILNDFIWIILSDFLVKEEFLPVVFDLLSPMGFLGGSDGKASCLQCERPGFDPWVGKIPWRRKWHPTPGEFHILAWRIPWTEEPGRLQSMGLQRVGHD